MTVRYILTELLLPPGLNFWLLLVALLLWQVRRGWAILLAVLALGGLLLLSLPVVKCRLFQGLEPYPVVDLGALDQQPQAPGAIVVLGGGIHKAPPEYGRSVVAAYSLQRLMYGVELHRATGLPLLLSGGNPSQAERSEAEAMAEILRAWAIEPGWVETNSLTTWENASYSAAYLEHEGIDRILLVTSAWHLPRAVYSFQQAGTEVIPAPTGFQGRCEHAVGEWVPSAFSLYLNSRALREYLGLLAYHLGQGVP
ncbi:MAG: YdcF family protein [Pseudomonadota bacterium]|nr:hypothetical protein [Pseudomonadales bacterium]MDY6919047.1 YdcF family protein [Pseudomonadota bacterium]